MVETSEELDATKGELTELIALHKQTLEMQKKHLYVRTGAFSIILVALAYMLISLYVQGSDFNAGKFQVALTKNVKPLTPEITKAVLSAFNSNKKEIATRMERVLSKSRINLKPAVYKELGLFSKELPQLFVDRVQLNLRKNMFQHLHEFSIRYPEFRSGQFSEELVEDMSAELYLEATKLTERDMAEVGKSLQQVISLLHEKPVNNQIEALSHNPEVNNLFIGSFLDIMVDHFPPPELQ